MDDDENLDDESDLGIDTELLLQSLLSLAGDEALRMDVVEKLVQKTNLPPEKVEMIMKAAVEYLKRRPNSN